MYRALRRILHDNVPYLPGTLIELTPAQASRLIESGAAEEVGDAEGVPTPSRRMAQALPLVESGAAEEVHAIPPTVPSPEAPKPRKGKG